MTRNPYRRPTPMTVRRGLTTAASGLIGATILIGAASALPAPPLTTPRELDDWWRLNGTVVAAFSMVRLTGLALSTYVAALGLTMTIAAATRWDWAEALARRCATAGVRRLIIGSGLAAGLSVPSTGSATSATVFDVTDLGPLESPFELRDEGPAPRGPVPAEPPGPRVLGPIPPGPSAPDAEPARSAPSTVEETWIVEPGDHLWSIAAETVADRQGDDTESAIATYWLRLIERNRHVVGDNPDLIHPGQQIVLPD